MAGADAAPGAGASDARIFAHHAGGRGFGVAFNVSEAFRADVVHVLYEADEACARAMIAENNDPGRIVLPFCLGHADGTARLNITHTPFASSLYRPNPYYADYACEIRQPDQIYDAVYGSLFRVEREVDVDVRSLDSLLGQNQLPAGALPDFLSLDTQGSEFDIIEGGRALVDRNVLGIATEIEFHPMYSGQKLFQDLLVQLDRMGFHFVNFTHLEEITPRRVPVGLRAKGFVAFGDALFLRRIEGLKAMARDESHHFAMLHKLAFIAVVFQQVEYALEALEAARVLKPSAEMRRALEARVYFQFLKRLEGLANETEPVLPPTEPDGSAPIHPDPSSAASAQPGKSFPLRQYERLRGWVDSRPTALGRSLILRRPHEAVARAVLRGLRYVYGCFIRRPALARILGALLVPGGSQSHQGHTAVESLFYEYLMPWTGEAIRQRRLQAQRYVLRPEARR